MALKDWKQLDNNEWRRKDETLHLIIFSKGTQNLPQVQIHKLGDYGIYKIVLPAKSFKSKFQALKFAKNL